MMRTVLVVTLGLSLAWSEIARASTIITLITPDEIMMAADSRRQTSQRGAVTGHTDDFCKIFVVGDFIFGFAGFTGDRTEHFDPRQRVVEILRKHQDSLGAAAAAIADRLFDDYLFALDRLRRESRQAYAQQARKNVLASVIIAGFEGERARAISIEFPPRASEPPVPTTTAPPRLIVIGNRSAIGRDIDAMSGRSATNVEEVIGYAKKMIQKQGEQDPAVGGEIDVVRLTKAGHHWPQIKPGCRPQE